MTRTQKLGIRLLSLLLVLACVFAVAQPVAAEEADVESTLVSVVRCRARYGATSIGQMEDGTEVTILGESGSFYKIDCYDMTGYIAKDQVVHTDDGSFIRCQADSSETRTLEYTAVADALVLRNSLLKLTRQQLGSAYVYGGSRPGAFDCSGLTSYIYRKHAVSLHRTADAQLQDGMIVAKENMQVGDLVFFREAGCPWLASHVGIYVGDGQMIHAGSRGVSYADLDTAYYRGNFLCARRIFHAAPTQLEEIPSAGMESAASFQRSVSGLR